MNMKYKVWHIERKEWIQDTWHVYIDPDGDVWEIDERGGYTPYMEKKYLTDKVKIVWYTGLKDRNDMEMYEGDVIACESNGVNRENRVICYDSVQARYKAVPLSAYHLNAGNGGWTGYELKYHNEVIGNIYEHPHLLEGEQT